MHWRYRGLLITSGVAAAAMAGCSASTSTGGTETPTATATAAATATATAATTQTPAPTAVATTTDPCQLVTSSEASALAGTSFGQGSEETTSGNGKICVYGGTTRNVFEVFFAQLSDATTANNEWSAEEAKVQQALNGKVPAGVNLNVNINDTSVAGADRAATGAFSATYSGVMISGSAIYLLKGADFVSFSDLTVGQTAASTSALEAQAPTTLSRI